MRYRIRQTLDKLFTVLTAASVCLMILVLIGVLGPMLGKGATAVLFKSTVEFRRMQYDLHGRGSQANIDKQVLESNQCKQFVYDRLDSFAKGISVETFVDEAKNIYRDYGKDLRHNEVQGQDLSDRRGFVRRVRDDLEKAFKSTDKAEAMALLDGLEQYKDDQMIVGTEVEKFFTLATEYRAILEHFDLSRREEYSAELSELQLLVLKLFGPRADDQVPAMVMDRYGATRVDLAEQLYNDIIWKKVWVQPADPTMPLVQEKVLRQESFAGTEAAEIFPYLEENFEKIMMPRPTFYWQYFFDDSVAGHYFGGVGPEIFGTLILTLIAMLFVFPLGVISAAYLVECASENLVVRIIRMCINTLAGVPSIVFGLFGLAFFVLFLFPTMGLESKPCILSASLTLAVLTLPVMIRASEEAIRSVPQAYKEASLGLGASQFTTFVKVTLPAAMPGILTGVILSLSRVAGETAPILFTGAVAFGAMPRSLFSQTRTLSYGSYDLAVGDRIGMLVPHNQYGMVVTLVLLIICLNAIAIYFRARIFRRLKGH